MDGISGAAAVIGLVQVTTQVTTALGRYVSSVKRAESSRANLLEQIKLMSTAEKAIQTVVRNSPRSSREPELQALVDEWFRADGLPFKCKGELEKLSHWLERQVEDRKRNKWGKMVVWPVKEDKIQATIRAFEAYMPYFHHIVSIESL
ncbi:hypothetical protein J3R83DRAFT_13625 [Lanmaoa asiatica]|nr:hypothetical protein J3R83DRAFT_13625 [Lanmaoa asiatica]